MSIEGACITQTPEGVLLRVRVLPNSKRDEIIVSNGRVRVSVKKEARDGKANKHVTALLKKSFGDCEIKKGHCCRDKTILIKNTLMEDVLDKLSEV